MWDDVKKKFHTAFIVILGLTFLVAPWDIYSNYNESYKGTVYSLILQPPQVQPAYRVSISVESLIVNIIIVCIIFGLVYFGCKKFVYKE